MTAAIRDLTRPLLAWWVGDFDLYAAEDAAQAQALANALGPMPEPLGEVREATPGELEETRVYADGGTWTLRALLFKQTEPGYLAGYEQ